MSNDTAIIWGTRKITWQQMDVFCAHAMGQLKTFGFKPGDRVAICAQHHPNTSLSFLVYGAWGLWSAPLIQNYPRKAYRRICLKSMSFYI